MTVFFSFLSPLFFSQCHLETRHSDTPSAHEPADHTLVLPWLAITKENLCHAMMSAPTN